MKKIIMVLFMLGLTAGFCLPTAKIARAAGAWVVEWDLRNGLRELEKNSFDRAILFAAAFNSEDSPFVQETLRDFLREELRNIARPGQEIFLCVVNDRFYEDGRAVQKDSELIGRLMASETSRQKHKDELLGLLALGDLTGLELDYEKVSKDDWPVFVAFIEELHRDMSARGRKLRVVLEPRQDCLSSDFPEGPEYVLMAYNLFGGHSGPGPKADNAFLEKLASWCAHMRVKPRLALSTGGFCWQADVVLPLTEWDARRKSMSVKVEPERDENTAYLRFRYTDPYAKPQTLMQAIKGVQAEVWYADGESLAALARKALSLGFPAVDLWRLGGNLPGSLAGFLEVAK